MKEKEAISGIFMNAESGKVLLLRRNLQRTYSAGKWDLMGGDIKLGETPKETLEKDAKEKLNVNVTSIEEKGEIMTKATDAFIKRHCFICKGDYGEVKIDFTALKEKLKRAYAKLDKMEDYIYYFGCRQEYILNYFSDTTAKPCGQCDNCLTAGGYQRKHQLPRKKSHGEKISKVSLDNIVEKPNSALSTKLTQLETFDLYNKGLAPEEIAAERNLALSTVIGHLAFLIEKGLIKNIDKLVGLDRQKKIKKAITKIGGGKLKPVKEELGEDISYEEIKLVFAKMNCKK